MPMIKGLACIFFTFLFTSLAHANFSTVQLTPEERLYVESNPVIRVGNSPDYVPFNFQKEGIPVGYSIDLIEMLAHKVGFKVNYVQESFPRQLSHLRSGDIDLLMSLYKTADREKDIIFSEPYKSADFGVFVNQDNSSISQISDIHNLRVALVKGDALNESVKQSISTIEAVYVNSYLEALRAVSLGKADATVQLISVGGHWTKKQVLTNLRVVGEINQTNSGAFSSLVKNYHIGVNKKNPMLYGIISKALASVSEGEWSKLDIQWVRMPESDEKDIAVYLNQNERDWLREHPVIRVGVDPKWAPIEFKDESGHYHGVAIDYLTLVQEYLNVTFEIVKGRTWKQLMGDAKEGKIDLLTALSETRERAQFLTFTEPYLDYPIAIFTRTNGSYISSLVDLKGAHVAVVSGYAIEEWLTQDYPYLNLESVSSIEIALELLQGGDVDAVVENLATTGYYIGKHNMHTIKVAGTTEYRNELTMGVRKDWGILKDIIQKVLKAIPDKKHHQIYSSWSTVQYDHTFNFGTLVKVFGIVLSIALIILIWNWKLRKEVTSRTHKLARAEKLYKEFIEVSSQGVCILEFSPPLDTTLPYDTQVSIIQTSLKIVECNDAFARLYGFNSIEDTIGNSLGTLFGDDESGSHVITRWIDQKYAFKNIELEQVTQAGAQQYVLINLLSKMSGKKITSIMGTVADLTDFRDLEQRVRQNEKMDAIGNLAGGIAHDFNNILGGIYGFTQISMKYAEEGSKLKRNLNQIKVAADRAKDLIDKILRFSRKGETIAEPLLLSPIIKEVVGLLRATIPKTVVFEEHLSDDTRAVMANATNIHELLMNVCSNAAYAMNNRGKITVSHEEIVLSEGVMGYCGESIPGAYSVVTVRDTGPGIARDTLSKVFDPYFTTKPIGSGTGMGLAVVHGIMNEIGGNIIIDTSAGRGSAFKFYLPKTDKKVKYYHPKTSNQLEGKGLVLLVDDEPPLIEVGKEILEDLGYTVEAYTDPSHAVRAIEREPEKFALMITDQTMPGMTGTELAGVAEIRAPKLPVILCTGYNLRHNSVSLVNNIKAVLKKPYNIEELKGLLSDVIDGKK
ncbi:MAG: transporter substrate-binding domain-containing protein [Fibrobacterales bacterium]